MLKQLRIKDFKNFAEAELSLGPFTLLIGANASGKSNLREALRFLHGVGRGYKLAEIIGGKWGQWEGVRGGAAEIAHRKADRFGLQLAWEMESVHDPWALGAQTITYEIEIALGSLLQPTIARESLFFGALEEGDIAFEALATNADGPGGPRLQARVSQSLDDDRSGWKTVQLAADEPVVAQARNWEGFDFRFVETTLLDTAHTLLAMRFIDLSPEAMRSPSVPGQRVLGDRGENLSSVLQTLCSDAAVKQDIIAWLRLLTPMDVADLRFAADVRGHVILMIEEADGHAYSAYSASDGTLRFLGLLAALFSPEPAVCVFEEIENGLHPTRIKLVLELIRARTREGRAQVIATTHSPAVLALLYDDELEHASLVYRAEGTSSARITRLLDIPDAARVLATHDRGELLASGWFEGMVEFAAVSSEPGGGDPTGAAA